MSFLNFLSIIYFLFFWGSMNLKPKYIKKKEKKRE